MATVGRWKRFMRIKIFSDNKLMFVTEQKINALMSVLEIPASIRQHKENSNGKRLQREDLRFGIPMILKSTLSAP